MTLLEQKVDAMAKALLANDTTDRNYALSQLQALMQQTPRPYEGAGEAVREALVELGVPGNVCGHRYLVTAIGILVQDPGKIRPVWDLYQLVAEEYNTTPSRVERGIRYATEVGCERAGMDAVNAYFGSTISPLSGKATNVGYLSRVAEVVRRRMEG